MNPRLSAAQWVVVATTATTACLAFGVVGLAIGTDYGGYFCTLCEFNGVTGYEATGQLGFLVGAPIGLVLGAWLTRMFLLRRNSTRNP